MARKTDPRLVPPEPGNSAPLTGWRRYRLAVFQGYLVWAMVAFLILTILAKTSAYFAVDVIITRDVQTIHAIWFADLMYALSWPGFMPEAGIISAIVLAWLYVRRLFWEAIVALVSGGGGEIVGQVIKHVVDRPRPSANLVNVVAKLTSYSFPSGHVLYYTTFVGFLFFLTFTLARPRPWRAALLVVLGAMVLLIGVSRVYEGEHWPSDVVAAYLLGSIWLSLSVMLYRWGKPRFFTRRA